MNKKLLFFVCLLFLNINVAHALDDCNFYLLEEMAKRFDVKIYLVGGVTEDVNCNSKSVDRMFPNASLKKMGRIWIYYPRGYEIKYAIAENNVRILSESEWVEGLNNSALRSEAGMWRASAGAIRSMLESACQFPLSGIQNISDSGIAPKGVVGYVNAKTEFEGDACLNAAYLIGLLGYEISFTDGVYRVRRRS